MPITIAQLRDAATRREVTDVTLDNLNDAGFQTDSWVDNTPEKTFIGAIATLFADFSEIAKSLVEFSWNKYASGVPLHMLSDSRFDNQVIEAIRTAGPMTLTNASTSAYTGIKPGQLVVKDVQGVRFRNTTGGDLIAGGQLILQWEAVKAGAAGNIPNSAALILETALAGVTVTNPVTVGTSWYSTAGADEESTANLRRRNQTKWATFGIEMVADGYEHYALTVAGITKVRVIDNNPRGPGTVDVLVSGDVKLTGDAQIDALQEIYKLRVHGTEGAGASDDSSVLVKHPGFTPFSIAGKIYRDPNYSEGTVRTNVERQLKALLARTPIGGEVYSPGPQNVISLDEIYRSIRAAAGVRVVELTSPTEDFVVPTTHLITEPNYAATLTYPATNSF